MSEVASDAIAVDVMALADLRDPQYSILRDRIVERLQAFDCSKSAHLQNFARGEVYRWEAHGHSRTYVMITPDGDDDIDVAAFFTVGMARLDLTKASKSQQKKLCGNISMDQTGAFSIAELARSDRYTNVQLPGAMILESALAVIESARALVGGRFVVVDAQPVVFDALYSKAGFSQIATAASPRGMEDAAFITACRVLRG